MQFVEDQFIQSKIKAGEDALRFPIRLNDKLAILFDYIKSADAKPTEQDQTVFEDLTFQVGKNFAVLKRVEEGLVPTFNTLAEHSRKPVIDLKKKTDVIAIPMTITIKV